MHGRYYCPIYRSGDIGSGETFFLPPPQPHPLFRINTLHACINDCVIIKWRTKLEGGRELHRSQSISIIHDCVS